MELTHNQKVDICAKVLRGYLLRCDYKQRQEHMKVLHDEKEGWVCYQLTKWAAEDIKKVYKFDVFDMGNYYDIDIYEELCQSLVF